MIQVTQTKVLRRDVNLARLRDEFAERGLVLLPNLIAPELLNYLLGKIAAANFVLKHEGCAAKSAQDVKDEAEDGDASEFGTTLFMPQTEIAYFLFHLLLNKPPLFSIIERITGCGPIGNFVGRIHRTLAGENQHIDWHDDIADSRMVGLNVNLGAEAFQGGRFQLRERASQRLLGDIGNLGLGNAFLFRVSADVEHRLTPVEEGGSRTVGVGWFRAQPVWHDFAQSFFRPHQ